MANPLMALQVQTPNIDVAGSMARGQEMQTARLGNLLAEFKMKQEEAAANRTNSLAALYNEIGPDLASGDEGRREIAINRLAPLDPEAALGYREKGLTLQKSQGDIKKNDLDLAKGRAEFIGRAAAGVLEAPEAARPLLYQRALQQAKDLGVDVAGAPQQYDENAVRNMMDQALSVKDRIDAHLAQETAAATQANATRDDEYRATNDKANRDVTIRGQNLTDARARDTNAQQGAFGSNSIDANAYNMLLKGEVGTPQYAAAYAHLSQPKTYFDPQSGQLVKVPPVDLSWAKKPGQQGQQEGAPRIPMAAAGNAPAAQSDVTVTTVAPPRPTEGQQVSALFADRADGADAILAEVGEELANPASRIKGAIPGGNFFQGQGYQRAEQAQRDFVNAILRKESGANITPGEFESAAKQYFPAPGDGPDVKAQKAKNRRTAIEGLKRMAGPGYKDPATSQGDDPQAIVDELRRRGVIK